MSRQDGHTTRPGSRVPRVGRPEADSWYVYPCCGLRLPVMPVGLTFLDRHQNAIRKKREMLLETWLCEYSQRITEIKNIPHRMTVPSSAFPTTPISQAAKNSASTPGGPPEPPKFESIPVQSFKASRRQAPEQKTVRLSSSVEDYLTTCDSVSKQRRLGAYLNEIKVARQMSNKPKTTHKTNVIVERIRSTRARNLWRALCEWQHEEATVSELFLRVTDLQLLASELNVHHHHATAAVGSGNRKENLPPSVSTAAFKTPGKATGTKAAGTKVEAAAPAETRTNSNTSAEGGDSDSVHANAVVKLLKTISGEEGALLLLILSKWLHGMSGGEGSSDMVEVGRDSFCRQVKEQMRASVAGPRYIPSPSAADRKLQGEQSYVEARDKELTFSPVRSAEKEKALHSARKDHGLNEERLNRLYNERKAWEESRDQKKKAAEAEELASCTFKPNIPTISHSLAESMGISEHQQDARHYLKGIACQADSTSQRLPSWMERELAECTFKPKFVTSPRKKGEGKEEVSENGNRNTGDNDDDDKEGNQGTMGLSDAEIADKLAAQLGMGELQRRLEEEAYVFGRDVPPVEQEVPEEKEQEQEQEKQEEDFEEKDENEAREEVTEALFG